MKRKCAVCRTFVDPWYTTIITAHEFECYKQQPDKVLPEHLSTYKQLLIWEKRSKIAKANAAKRRG